MIYAYLKVGFLVKHSEPKQSSSKQCK